MAIKTMPVLSLGIFLATVAIAHSTPPDAGQLLREQQPQRQIPQQLPKPDAEVEKPPLAERSFVFIAFIAA